MPFGREIRLRRVSGTHRIAYHSAAASLITYLQNNLICGIIPLDKLEFDKGCDCMKLIKKIAVLVAPLLLFAVLLIPYSWVNQQFIVEWFGCGCPVLDEFGNMVENNFNVNDFTALFWLFVSICTTIISVLLSKRILKETLWLRVLYVVGMLVASLFISYQFYQMMMWN